MIWPKGYGAASAAKAIFYSLVDVSTEQAQPSNDFSSQLDVTRDLGKQVHPHPCASSASSLQALHLLDDPELSFSED